MPIISNYNPISGSGGTVTGGSFNNAPYPECFVRFVPIPSDEKFLLIPAKQESREIDVTFNQPTELYFGSEELPFKLLPIGEKYKDTQLGVDLWVKCLEPDCQCLLIIRSEKVIDYIGVTPTPTPTPTPQPWLIIAPDQFSASIDSSKFPDQVTSIEVSVIVPNFQDILYYEFWRWIGITSDPYSNQEDTLLDPIYDENGENIGFNRKYPQTPGEMVFLINSNFNSIYFDIGDNYDYVRLKILGFDFATNTFSLGE